MSRAVSVVLAAGMVVLAGVGATAATSSGPSAAPDDLSSTEGGLLQALAGQESSFGPLTAQVAKPPNVVLGSDKQRHLVYEIPLVNTAPIEQTVTEVVVRAKGSGRVLARYDTPEEITAIMTTSTTQNPGVDELAANGAGMLFVNVSLPRDRRVPSALEHEIVSSIEGAGEFTVNGASTGVVRRAPALLSPPLKGEGYLNANGCCDRSPHTRALLNVDGVPWLAQRFAIDWIRADDQGRIFVGDWQDNDSWVVFGDPVHSASGGKVVETLNTMPENTPPTPATDLTPETALGNHVIVDMGDGRFALYAHLQPGSVTVDVGDRVRPGQRLGRVGNTGSSTAPHLHFHVTDGPSAVGSNGLPYEFKKFLLTDLVLNSEELNADVPAQVAELGPAPAPQVRRHQLPMQGVLVTFPPN